MTANSFRLPDSEALFAVAGLTACRLAAGGLSDLQAFFERNPDYFLAATGEPPASDEAAAEFETALPGDWPHSAQWLIGFYAADRSLTAMATLVADLFAPGVWHLGLFIVETGQHGRGVARQLYAALEVWLRVQGARWVRLGVIAGNVRAERFWERNGFIEVRRRVGVEMKARTQTLRVMVKPLRGDSLRDYLASVARDRPDTP
ncbi:GNAT family N-acetyltransferase [Burkholderia alba]|uniref:GNAT family N-acetyltransferase n=1 Tax=Burkholderia alba TaxID=2683677 RepID=UPI002B057B74|nr:GNAT family N-acetyltransferase [Burkholderia alba]